MSGLYFTSNICRHNVDWELYLTVRKLQLTELAFVLAMNVLYFL